MKRVLIGLVIGALAFSGGAVAGKVVNVTNPMSADLDGGGFNVGNVTNYTTRDGAILGGDGFTGWSVVLCASPRTSTNLTGPCVLKFAGTADPTVAPPIGNNPVGSEYTQVMDSAHAALWFKTGPNLTDWTRVAASP